MQNCIILSYAIFIVMFLYKSHPKSQAALILPMISYVGQMEIVSILLAYISYSPLCRNEAFKSIPVLIYAYLKSKTYFIFFLREVYFKTRMVLSTLKWDHDSYVCIITIVLEIGVRHTGVSLKVIMTLVDALQELIVDIVNYYWGGTNSWNKNITSV